MSEFPIPLNHQERRHQRELFALEKRETEQNALLTQIARRYPPSQQVGPPTEKEVSMKSEIKKLLPHLQHAHLFRFQGASYWYDKPGLIDPARRKSEINEINRKKKEDVGGCITPTIEIGPLAVAYNDVYDFFLMASVLGENYKTMYQSFGRNDIFNTFGGDPDMNFFAEGWDNGSSGFTLDSYLDRMGKDEGFNMIVNRTKPMKYQDKEVFGVVIGTKMIRESGTNGYRNPEGRESGQPATFMFLFDQDEYAASAQKLIGKHPNEFLREFHQQFISGKNLEVPENNSALSTLISSRDTYNIFVPSAQIKPKLNTNRDDFLVTPHY